MHWQPVIGLEIHAQLATRSKIFSGAATAYGATPNTQACAVDLGLPGVLPVLNAEVVRMAVMFGLAIDAQVSERSIFARKNYFYPDLPKGYQISQYELPIVTGGHLEVTPETGAPFTVRVTRAHLEEDAGKSLHQEFQGLTAIDLNRAGTPLIEIVSEPDMHSAEQAVAYMRKVHAIVRYLGICDGNMQEGSFRCDANVSIRPLGSTTLGTRAELKNLNSFRFVERAIDFEIQRQIVLLESGGTVAQETRLYDEKRDETRSMRSKEEAEDYRYFPDPDLLPVVITEDFIEAIRATLPELPDARQHRFKQQFGLGADLAGQLTASRAMADYFEATHGLVASDDAKLTANWITGELAAHLKRQQLSFDACPVTPEMLAGLLTRIADGTVSGTAAKQALAAMWDGQGDADSVIEAFGLEQMSDSGELEKAVDVALAANPSQVQQYRGGKTKVLGFLVGQVMKASGGKANPRQVSKRIKDKLDDDAP
ncbi:MAG: Asp-tRNA(Asn)/Glu-tRNA(Gln) amidotransferase subunit GatB [Gammaproteobacteria bacterium]|nr:MAG: Asp-tRNA(Asn)/Glu-tRNA(Gln) amidotransferase subunit GatB [Gammaproteobacteria bacterium]